MLDYFSGKDFYTIFDNGLAMNDLSCRKLSENLEDEGYHISPRSLQRWHNRTALPGVENAKIVVKYLYKNFSHDLPSDEEIKECLERAKLKKMPESSNESALIATIRINYSTLFRKKIEPGEAQFLLQERIKETVGNEPGKYSRYVTELIRKDLNQKILPKRK